jgi:excisionase family DNA binding protein
VRSRIREVIVNLKTAARRLGVHYQTAYRWVRSGQLVAVKVGAGYEISDAALARFQAQRSALERASEKAIDLTCQPTGGSRENALRTLDRMLDAVARDAQPVVQRATRLAVEILGDGAVCSLRTDDGDLDVAYVAHIEPVIEVQMATVAREVPFTKEFARKVMRANEPIFVPQVPQRDVRRSVGPEQHQYLVKGSCFSLISVPIAADGRLDGVLLLMRDEPGRPYERQDVEFVEALATRVSRALGRAEACRTAWDARKRAVETIGTMLDENQSVDAMPRAAVDDMLAATVAGDPETPIAVLDLELRHVACTKPYAALLGHDPTYVLGTRLDAFVRDDQPLHDAFDRVLTSELDFRSVEIVPIAGAAPIVLHVAMVRRADATPWGIVVVAQMLLTAPPARRPVHAG